MDDMDEHKLGFRGLLAMYEEAENHTVREEYIGMSMLQIHKIFPIGIVFDDEPEFVLETRKDGLTYSLTFDETGMCVKAYSFDDSAVESDEKEDDWMSSASESSLFITWMLTKNTTFHNKHQVDKPN